MNLQEIKAAVLAGKDVYCRSNAYKVVKDNLGQWLIVCSLNGYTIGLTWMDNVSLNGKEEDFYVGGSQAGCGACVCTGKCGKK